MAKLNKKKEKRREREREEEDSFFKYQRLFCWSMFCHWIRRKEQYEKKQKKESRIVTRIFLNKEIRS